MIISHKKRTNGFGEPANTLNTGEISIDSTGNVYIGTDNGNKQFSSTSKVSDGWELVEEKIIPSVTTTFDFDTTLDGNTDLSYFCTFNIMNGAALSVSYGMRINAASWGLTRQSLTFNGTSISTTRVTGNVPFTLLSSAPNTRGDFWIFYPNVRTTSGVRYCFYGTVNKESSVNISKGWCYISTPAIGTNFTSLGLFANQTDGIGQYSVGTLWKI